MTDHDPAHPKSQAPRPQAQRPDAGDTAPLARQPRDDDARGTKGGTSFDTILGRRVVDQGLATREEVEQALSGLRAAADNERTLADVLLDNDVITRGQLQRLRFELEAERSTQQIPGYKIIEKLGAGAMATVWKAKQLSLNRLVAIKILPKKYSGNEQFIQRFYAEGRAAAQLNHPHIVQAYDVGQAGDFHYFVMEFVDGRTVYDDIVKLKRYPERDALRVVIQVAEALQHAHAKGLIHRDVKPKNVMINNDGVVKLADMGLARAVSDKEAAEAEKGRAFGTPYYISPEQIKGEERIGPPADIYSLGATLYHMVTGQVPFDGTSPTAVMHKHLKAELVPPDHVNPKLSPSISQVIEMMMARRAADRYQTAADLLADLRAVDRGQTPPMAHKDLLGATDLAAVQAAVSAAQPVEMPVDRSSTPSRVEIVMKHPLTWVLLVLSITSLIVNVFQALS